MKNKPFIKAVIFTQASNGYAHVKVGFTYVIPATVEELDYTKKDKQHFLAGLVVSSQTDKQRTITDPLYGYQVNYERIFSTGLTDLKRMVKTLTKVQHGLADLSTKAGYPSTFADYVLRVFHILKVKEIVYNDKQYDRREVPQLIQDLSRAQLAALKQ